MTQERDETIFEQALAECSERLGRGEALEECLLDYPDYRSELQRLLPAGMQVIGLREDPSAAFEAHLEERLLLEVDRQRAARKRPAWRHLAQICRPAAVALVLLLAVGGTGEAARESLPDSPLYGVKGVREWAERSLARSDEAIVLVNARQVAERNRELEETVRRGRARAAIEALTRRVRDTLDPMVTRAEAAAAGGNRQPATRTLNELRNMRERVDRAAEEASPEARAVLDGVRFYLEGQEARLQRALGRQTRTSLRTNSSTSP